MSLIIIKSFSKENSKLRIQSKPDRNQSRLTVWNDYLLGMTKLPSFDDCVTAAL